jgi:hypothetical protein
MNSDRDQQGLLNAVLGDGRFLIIVTGLSLATAGGFAVFQAATGHFLPHDVEFLGMTANELCGLDECRIVHFMIHDRVSFGGVLVTIGSIYMYLAEFPLRRHQAWAWWALAASGLVGFASFLTYLGYGYLDSWHGVATLLLLPCFVIGLIRAWPTLAAPRGVGALLARDISLRLSTPLGLGRSLLLSASLGIVGAGLTIMTVGMTTVFVPQDLQFMGLAVEDLRAISPRLIPLIAHDRAGFGGALTAAGVALAFTIWCAPASKHLWQILAVAGCVGFTSAIAVHFVIGYDDPVHLAPACLGAVVYGLGLALTFRPMLATRK